MIYIRCGIAFPGAIVTASDASEALATIRELERAQVQILALANDVGEALTMTALKLMAASNPIFVEGFYPIDEPRPN